MRINCIFGYYTTASQLKWIERHSKDSFSLTTKCELRCARGKREKLFFYLTTTPALVPGIITMSERTLSGSIALTKLNHVLMEKKGKSGMIKGIFIPIELNHLETKDDAVYLPIRVTAKDETDSYGQNGFIAKSVKRDKKWSEMTADEQAAEKGLTPILGNLKDFSMGGGNDAAGAASAPVGEEDDLPF